LGYGGSEDKIPYLGLISGATAPLIAFKGGGGKPFFGGFGCPRASAAGRRNHRKTESLMTEKVLIGAVGYFKTDFCKALLTDTMNQ
jgi:hypothetical protein